MQKYLFIITFCILFATVCTAQKNDKDGFILNIQPQAFFGTGDIKGKYGVGYGGHITGETPFAQQFRWTVGLGGTLLVGKTYDSPWGYETEYPDIATIQLRGGIKFFPVKKKGIFISGAAGPVTGIIESEAKFGFTFRTMAGIEFGNFNYYDISVGYDYSGFKEIKVGGFVISIGYHL